MHLFTRNFHNLFNPNATADLTKINAGIFNGFMIPRNQDGSWNQTYNVTNCGGCSWNDLTYEGLLWEYAFAVPHDIAALIELFGGNVEFIKRLDASFVDGFSDTASVGSSNGVGTR
jgi:putative alpha-1,2-mannosidase